jgi:hypothetical protein
LRSAPLRFLFSTLTNFFCTDSPRLAALLATLPAHADRRPDASGIGVDFAER